VRHKNDDTGGKALNSVVPASWNGKSVGCSTRDRLPIMTPRYPHATSALAAFSAMLHEEHHLASRARTSTPQPLHSPKPAQCYPAPSLFPSAAQRSLCANPSSAAHAPSTSTPPAAGASAPRCPPLAHAPSKPTASARSLVV
jgi:hypothetical protein